MTTFYPPGRALWLTLRTAFRRVNCGRRFGHFKVSDEFGYPACTRCGTPLM